MANTFLCGRFEFTFERPLVMGIVNITPDSFSDGGQHGSTDAAVSHAHRLIREGVDILDLGAESTRPGAVSVSINDELSRLLPVIEALRDCGVPLSVDTFKPEVMQAVLAAGVDMINDIYGFRRPGAIEAVAQSDCGLCLMHMKGEPSTMQEAPNYDDLLSEVEDFLRVETQKLLDAGINPRRITLDPGFGFGKTADHNYLLLNRLSRLRELHYPLLTGLSRKRMIGDATGKPVTDRVAGSVAGALACVARGAFIVRVHDVSETVDALKVWHACEQGALKS
jgi:dihydropteroate synthase